MKSIPRVIARQGLGRRREGRPLNCWNCWLFAEGFGGGGEDAWYAEWLGEVPGHPQVHCFDGARLGGESRNDNDRDVCLQPARLANDGEAVYARHLEVGDQQIV